MFMVVFAQHLLPHAHVYNGSAVLTYSISSERVAFLVLQIRSIFASKSVQFDWLIAFRYIDSTPSRHFPTLGAQATISHQIYYNSDSAP